MNSQINIQFKKKTVHWQSSNKKLYYLAKQIQYNATKKLAAAA